MEGYVSAVRDDDGTVQFIPVDGGVGIYRSGDDGSVWARTDGRDVHLGFRDRSVSRMRDFGAPIRIEREPDGFYVHNVDNASKLHLVSLPGEPTLARGDRRRVTGDTVVELGYQTTIQVSVERTPRDGEATVENDLPGSEDGVPINAHVPVLCEFLREKETRTEAYRIGQQLLDTVEDHPLDLANYEEAREALERHVDQLNDLAVASRGSADEKTLTDDRLQLQAEIADRIEKLYERA